MFATGARLARYEIISFMAKGGMGEVHRARDMETGRDVALKTLLSGGAEEHDRVRRFIHEAKAAASIDHPNVAVIYEIGQADGLHFIAMEFVQGETLRRLIERGGIPEDKLVEIAIQISEGLSAAHAQHVVHRDLKPSNIMLTPSGQVKLLDFGLAKTVMADSHTETISRHTEIGTIMGTVSYMSPEQAMGTHLDHRSDLFSLGVVLYELATRRLPFCGLNAIQTINRIMNAEPERICRINSAISPGLERIILRCLEKDAENRFQSADELAHDLRRPEPDTQIRARIAPAPNNLPQQLTRFIGRRTQISDIHRFLGEHRLVTLAGPGGMGKTRLALEVASGSLETYIDGVWFVELAALVDGALVAQSAAAAIGVRERRGQSITEALVEYLKARNALLVIDNGEHVLEACAALAETLLQKCGRLRVLVTSRTVLSLPGEAVLRVPPLDEAIELFADRAQLAEPAFVLDGTVEKTIATICRQLDGIPLAIELAASQVRIFSCEQISARLKDRLALLTGRSRTQLPRQQTLLAAIDWSYNLLSQTEQLLFRRLSVFAGGWTVEAAEAACAGGPVEAAGIAGLLTRLVDKSLVIPERRDGQQRYGLLTTLGKYAARRLKEADETASSRRRHAAFFLGLAETVSPKLRGADQSMWLDRLNTEHDNMRAALRFSIAHDLPTATRLAIALGTFWYCRGLLQEGRDWLLQLIALPQSSFTEAERANLLYSAGRVIADQSDEARGVELFKEALAFYRQTDDKEGLANVLNGLAVLTQRLGDKEGSRRYFEESLQLRREIGDSHGIASSLNNLGVLAYRTNDYKTARGLYQEALEIAREHGDKRVIAMAAHNLSNVVHAQGDLPLARSLREETVTLVRELGARNLIGIALLNLSELTIEQGEYEAAHSLLSEGLTLSTETGDKRNQAITHVNLAELAVHQGRSETARQHLNESLILLDEVEDKRIRAAGLQLMGQTAAIDGNYSQARSLYEQSLTMSESINNRLGIAFALLHLGDLTRREGDYGEARLQLQRSLSICNELKVVTHIVAPLDAVAALAFTAGNYERAARLWGAVHELREKMSLPRHAVEREGYERNLNAVRAALGDNAFSILWDIGLRISLQETIEYVLQEC